MRIKLREDTSWRLNGTKRWKWEEEGRVMVLSAGSVGQDRVKDVAAIIREMFTEFNLPIEVDAGKAGEELTRCISELKTSKELDVREFVRQLNHLRKNFPALRPGLAILVRPEDFDPFGKASDTERGYYGESHDDGVCLLRSYHREAVRHEIGHMLGLGEHCRKDPSCVMQWNCRSGNFCPSCRAALESCWEIVSDL